MTYKELQATLKQYKEQGLTTVKLNSKTEVLQAEYDRLSKKQVSNDTAVEVSNPVVEPVSEGATEQTHCSVEAITWTNDDEAERRRICVGLAVSRGYNDTEANNLYDWAISQTDYGKVYDKFISRLEGGYVPDNYSCTRDNLEYRQQPTTPNYGETYHNSQPELQPTPNIDCENADTAYIYYDNNNDGVEVSINNWTEVKKVGVFHCGGKYVTMACKIKQPQSEPTTTSYWHSDKVRKLREYNVSIQSKQSETTNEQPPQPMVILITMLILANEFIISTLTPIATYIYTSVKSTNNSRRRRDRWYNEVRELMMTA